MEALTYLSAEAEALRDWMKYRNDNHLYKEKVRQVINKWIDPRSKSVLTSLNAVLNQSTVTAWNEITRIYTTSIPQIEGPITTPDGVCTDFILIQQDPRSVIYSATMHTDTEASKSVIVKAYISINRNSFATNEDAITMLLSTQGLMVPKRYSAFNTEHYICLPMEKLDYTLKDLFTTNELQGIDSSITLEIIRAFIPILELLHTERKLFYVDFSCGNVAFRQSPDGSASEVCMIDFGALHGLISVSPCMKTLRYCSANAAAEKPVDAIDDLQSLGFILMDCMYGPLNLECPLNTTLSTEAGKLVVVKNSINGLYGPFIQEYFSLIHSNKPYENLLDMCDRYS